MRPMRDHIPAYSQSPPLAPITTDGFATDFGLRVASTLSEDQRRFVDDLKSRVHSAPNAFNGTFPLISDGDAEGPPAVNWQRPPSMPAKASSEGDA